MDHDGGGYLVTVYAVYATVSVGLTVWLARTLHRNGAVFLEDVFEDSPGLARSLNTLLVIGFYLLNLGYALLLLRARIQPSTVAAVEVLVRKLGILLVSLGGIHFVNMWLFWRIRRRAHLPDLPPPVQPQAWLPPAPPTAPQGWAQPSS